MGFLKSILLFSMLVIAVTGSECAFSAPVYGILEVKQSTSGGVELNLRLGSEGEQYLAEHKIENVKGGIRIQQKDGTTKVIKDEVEALNLLSSMGWEAVNLYTVIVFDKQVVRYLLKSETVSYELKIK